MKIFQKLIVRTLFYISVFIIGVYGSVAYQIGTLVYLDTKKPADAILVLGAASYKGTVYNPCLVSRINHAIDLQKQRYAPLYIFSGGDDRYTGINESESMKKIANGLGITDSQLLLESKATSTYENILLSRQLMLEHNLRSVIIVTEPFHSPRAGFIAKHLGLQYYVSPATDSPCWQRWKFFSRYFLREPFAIIYYFLRGRI